jgi:pyruvate ferredoxin oxidoreductase gamma subunit
MDDIAEIRWHGRGGQGAVTASEILAEAALEEGKYFQAFPDYGPERMGAPIRAYTRIGSSPIRQHCQITQPDAVVVLDPTLVGVVDFTDGLKEEGVLVVNTPLSPAELRSKLGFDAGKVFTVDATRTTMIGALIKALEVVSKKGVQEEISKRLETKGNKEMARANIEAFERAYNEVAEA